MFKTKSTKRALVMSVLSLVLCVSMFVGTTFAWFTDEVVSSNNIIKSGSLDVEMFWSNDNTNWTDASTGAIFNYQYWEPGYTEVKYIKIQNVGDLAFKFQLNILPTVKPAAGEFNLADVIDVYMFDANATVNRDAIAAATPVGTLSELMADADGAAYGYLLPAEGKGDKPTGGTPRGELTYCIALKMQESAGNDYQNLTVGDGFAVQLLATQYTWEEDTFGDDYDEDAEYETEELMADVTVMDPAVVENLNIPLYSYGNFQNTGLTQTGLDKGFVFKTMETPEQGAESDYATWHADFVITFDNDVLTGTAGLAGQYNSWGLDWVGFQAFDVDTTDGVDGIPANMACRLLAGKGVTISYEELCRDVKTFNCGVFDVGGANAGTTMTVELRLYEAPDSGTTGPVDVEIGNYITIATYTYTFGA